MAVRVRPITPAEKSRGLYSVSKVLDRKMVVMTDPSNMKGGAVNEGGLGVKEKQYSFDHVFEEYVDTVSAISLTSLGHHF